MQTLENIKSVLMSLEVARKAKYRIRTGENTYEIFHFETEADQVITTPEKQFSSATEKASWNDKYTKEEINSKITILETADTALSTKINNVEQSLANKPDLNHNHEIENIYGLTETLASRDTVTSVNTKIATAKQEAVNIAAGDATAKAEKFLEDAKTYANNKKTEAVTDAQAYTNTKVAGLVDSAPETLNTLNELSIALGNDANFATTISTEIGKKLTTSVYDIDKNVIMGKLDIIQGDEITEGSINKALKDAKNYADGLSMGAGNDLSAITNKIAELEDTSVPGSLANKITSNTANLNLEITRANQSEEALKSRLNIIEGEIEAEGSIKKALSDAKSDATNKDNTLKAELLNIIETKADSSIVEAALETKANKDNVYTKLETYNYLQVDELFSNYLVVGSAAPTGATVWIETNQDID